ncbi:hypothetical protein ACQPZX_41335 [Actinoplanes sp. CA-142083]|uniref:hypothetical protein n=1 Tax=Actinoplanes sp. CA-142083 TaxID=3239903 RepID=UPI003D8BD597
MAKRVGQVPSNEWGEPTGPVEVRKVKRVRTSEIPWTRGPGAMSRWERIKRAAVG